MKLKYLVPLVLVALAAWAYARSDHSSRSGVEPTAFESAKLTSRGAPTWMTDFTEAKRLAGAENKGLVLDFTGSDWCPWCMRLDREVFATPEFQAFARQHLILVKVDFPAHHVQSPQERRQNEQLATSFGVDAFPTVWVLDAQGRRLGTLGYEPGGPSPFLANLSRMLGLK